MKINHKLTNNVDHYFSSLARAIYVMSRLKDKTIEYVLTRSSLDHSQIYRDDQKILTHLTIIYFNLTRVIEIKSKFRTLYMRNIRFQEFHVEVVYLTQKSSLIITE